jgi:hypothetical protein
VVWQYKPVEAVASSCGLDEVKGTVRDLIVLIFFVFFISSISLDANFL